MAGFFSMKMKRKELDEVNDDFSDFSLSSPARKIRRLDVELPPILEEEEPELLFALEQSGGAPAMEELPSVPVNEERAIVLFKPMNTPLLHSPSNFSISVDSDIISDFKNFWSSQSNHIKPAEDEAIQDSNTSAAKECLEVVPWVPSHVPQMPGIDVPQAEAAESMEAEEMEAAAMEIESNDLGTEQGQVNQHGGLKGDEGLPQWQHQHCMTPQLPQINTPTPIVWYQ
ncbi:uncharacterized protein LOC131166222 [Malania oleifera]|uniref:uncharacterized protein LOC131166222 n=1 Tax=Malania oleifera TaxID=397392 RepID=UPI0025AE20AE|nr:uncharacterized protein LOC131166222 [Malania oleifera]